MNNIVVGSNKTSSLRVKVVQTVRRNYEKMSLRSFESYESMTYLQLRFYKVGTLDQVTDLNFDMVTVKLRRDRERTHPFRIP